MVIPLVKNISEALKHYAIECPEKTYIISDSRKYSYYQVDKLVDRVCSLFLEKGISREDFVSIIINNSIEYIVIYLACLRFGTAVNPYPYNLEAKDISRYLGNVKPKLMLCKKKHYEEICNSVDFPVIMVDSKFLHSLPSSENNLISKIQTDYDSIASLYYSSGTTGNPKTIAFSHRNMVTNISSIVRGFNHKRDHTHLIILPLGHTASINYSFLPITLCGGTLVITESFWKIRSRFWAIIKEFNVNYVEVVPSIIVALLNTPYKKSQYKDINSLDYVGCGSASLPLDIQEGFRKKYGLKVANLYGLSETGPTHVDNPLESGWKPGSIGRPLHVNNVFITDTDGSLLGENCEGEIVIEGENVFVSYLNNMDLYNSVVKKGIFHTGDLGYYDKEGLFYFTGRKKELIIKGGINISPDEIDDILFMMDGVKEAATVGISDDYLGEKIVSFLVIEADKNLDIYSVKDFCSNFLSRDKVPDDVRFVKSIPKGPSGKILRRELQ